MSCGRQQKTRFVICTTTAEYMEGLRGNRQQPTICRERCQGCNLTKNRKQEKHQIPQRDASSLFLHHETPNSKKDGSVPLRAS